ASSLLPSSSLGEQFAHDFLQQKASEAKAPSTFSMKLLTSQLPKQSTSSTSLASSWSTEYSTRPVDSAMWSAEFLDNAETSLRSSPVSHALASELAEDWAQEYTAGQQHMLDGMENEWESIRQNLNKIQKEDLSQIETYEHQANNPFLTSAQPMMEGDRLMQEGDLGNAMLAYEAAVQKNPNDAEIDRVLQQNLERLVQAVEENAEDADAWCRLGLSHAENEHDAKAIAAFNKCLKIQPNNEEALLALSVSLANESVDNEALNQLEKWLVAHQGGDPTTVQKAHAGYSSFLDHDTFKQAILPFREAVEHFVSALDLQKGGKENSSIWPTLRSATIRMRGAPHDLLSALDRRDLNAFKA
ncbi:tetratricopeptide repeat protein, partial [Ostertagia ostertagi]